MSILTASWGTIVPLLRTIDHAGQVVLYFQETLASVSGSFMMDPDRSSLQDSYGLGGSLDSLGELNPNDMLPIFPQPTQLVPDMVSLISLLWSEDQSQIPNLLK